MDHRDFSFTFRVHQTIGEVSCNRTCSISGSAQKCSEELDTTSTRRRGKEQHELGITHADAQVSQNVTWSSILHPGNVDFVADVKYSTTTPPRIRMSLNCTLGISSPLWKCATMAGIVDLWKNPSIRIKWNSAHFPAIMLNYFPRTNDPLGIEQRSSFLSNSDLPSTLSLANSIFFSCINDNISFILLLVSVCLADVCKSIANRTRSALDI